MKSMTIARVIENIRIADRIYRAELHAPDIVCRCQPGQFINVYFPESIRIFPRPFSIAGVINDCIVLIYKVLGPQTTLMSQWRADDTVTILGPLGNGFNYNNSDYKPILLAGGVGVAPLMFLRDRIAEKGIEPLLFLGARSKSELPVTSDEKSELIVATDDGSFGKRGFITDILFDYLRENLQASVIYVCGPDAMMKTLKNNPVTDKMSIYVSLEKTMACGLGLCQGCIVTNSSDKSRKHSSLVCKDGPVFDLKDIEFND